MITCSGNLESWEPSQHLLLGTGKRKKPYVQMAGRRTFGILNSSQQSGIMKLVTTKYDSGGLHEKHVVATWNPGNHLIICF